MEADRICRKRLKPKDMAQALDIRSESWFSCTMNYKRANVFQAQPSQY
jgi:hypothetical protein